MCFAIFLIIIVTLIIKTVVLFDLFLFFGFVVCFLFKKRPPNKGGNY